MRNKLLKFMLSFFMVLALSPVQADDGEAELAEYMGTLQYFTHKLQLSLDAGNLSLASFYAHEVEEVIETLSVVDAYDGHPIGKLTDAMLKPPFELLEKQVKAQNIPKAVTQFEQFINACNACHQATEHGFIRIEKNAQNPYMQSFSGQ